METLVQLGELRREDVNFKHKIIENRIVNLPEQRCCQNESTKRNRSQFVQREPKLTGMLLRLLLLGGGLKRGLDSNLASRRRQLQRRSISDTR